MAIVKYIPKVYSRSQCQEHDFPLNLPHSETKIRIIQRDEWKKEMHKESNLSMPKLTVECEVTSNCALSKQMSERKLMLKFSQGHLPGIERLTFLGMIHSCFPWLPISIWAYCAMYSKSQGKQWDTCTSIASRWHWPVFIV